MVKRTPILQQDEHLFVEQADNYYVQEVLKGNSKFGLDGLGSTSCYQPKKKKYEVHTQAHIEQLVQDEVDKVSSDTVKHNVGIRSIIGETPKKVQRQGSANFGKSQLSPRESGTGMAAMDVVPTITVHPKRM